MREDGTLEKLPEVVEAVKDYFVNNRGLLTDKTLWERNDAKYQDRVKDKIEKGAREMVRRKAAALEKA